MYYLHSQVDPGSDEVLYKMSTLNPILFWVAILYRRTAGRRRRRQSPLENFALQKEGAVVPMVRLLHLLASLTGVVRVAEPPRARFPLFFHVFSKTQPFFPVLFSFPLARCFRYDDAADTLAGCLLFFFSPSFIRRSLPLEPRFHTQALDALLRGVAIETSELFRQFDNGLAKILGIAEEPQLQKVSFFCFVLLLVLSLGWLIYSRMG